MRAARFDTIARTLRVVDVPEPTPGPGEVLVNVAACGICHSDVGVIEGYLPTTPPVITLGHEASGVIAALGRDTAGWQVGDPVVLAAGRRCGRCLACAGGASFDDCLDPELMAFQYDGAWAEQVVVPVAALVRLPASLDLVSSAVIADAVATPYAALLDTGQLRPAESVAIWGLGGLGTHAVQIARLAGAVPIIGVDPLPAARERALELGADHVLDPLAHDAHESVRQLTDGVGVDVALDGVGQAATTRQANRSLAPGGRLVLMGMTVDRVDVGIAAGLASTRHRVLGHLGYRRAHMEQIVRLVARGRLDLSRSVSAVLPLEDIAEGVRHLQDQDGAPVRILVSP